MKKMNFKLNCDRNAALGFIDEKRQDGIEKVRCDAGGLELYLTSEENGVKVVEYVYSARIEERKIVGVFAAPAGDKNSPGPLISLLLAVLALILLAVMFSVVYLFVMLFARSWLLSLYIALPLFGGLFAAAAVMAAALSRKHRQVAKLKKYFRSITRKSKE